MLSLLCGMDPGLQRTGYAVIRLAVGHGDEAPSVVEAGVIRTDARRSLPARLAELAAGVAEMLREHRPGLMAVEQLYSHYRHPRTAILMGHARGVILSAAADQGIPVRDYSATRVKKTLTGRGQASKSQIQRAIVTTLGLPRAPEPPDVADALAIALCAAWDDRRRSPRAS